MATPKGTNPYGSYSEPEMYMGSLRGYRAWSFYGETDYANRDGRCEERCWPYCGEPEHMAPLKSVFISRYEYKPGVNEAICARDNLFNACPAGSDHVVPTPGCGCGFYATYYGFPAEYINRAVLGTVRATGRILLGERGFRSTKVEIESLAVGYDIADVERPKVFRALKMLGEHYDVPVFEHPAELLRAFPPVEVDGLPFIQTPEDYNDWPIKAGLVTNQGVFEIRQSPVGSIPGRAVMVNQRTRAVISVPSSYGFTFTDGETAFLVRWMTFSYIISGRAHRIVESCPFVTALDCKLDDVPTTQLADSWQHAWNQLDAEIRTHMEQRGRALNADKAMYMSSTAGSFA